MKALYHKTVKAVEKMYVYAAIPNTAVIIIMLLCRIADVFYFARSMKYEDDKTLEDALCDAYFKEPSDLSGYMAITDYFFYMIRYSRVKITKDVEKVKFNSAWLKWLISYYYSRPES